MAPSEPARPIAVVYRDAWTGPDDGDDTGAMAAMLTRSPWNFEIVIAGPDGDLPVREALAGADVRLYGQPGGAGDDESAFRRQKRDKSAIRQFVAAGGRYLGICMGAFLAEPGFFNIFPGRADEYYSSKGAAVTTADPALVEVDWRGQRRAMYFQDGAFLVPKRRAEATVLARYATGSIAALVSRHGAGRVALCGPHPEAPPAWYDNAGMRYPGPTQDLADDLITTLMA
jgi:hypothetical protein